MLAEFGFKLPSNFQKEESNLVVESKYEGGSEIWEGAVDLLRYLEEENQPRKAENVLDIGCGRGFLGTSLLKKDPTLRPSFVAFQDLNFHVLETYTRPLVELNVEKCDAENPKVHYAAEDWNNLSDLSSSFFTSPDSYLFDGSLKYDLILSSECTYRKKNFQALRVLVERLLAQSGIALFSSKRFYFGLDGGSWEFIDTFKDSNLTAEIVKTNSDNSTVRDIIKIANRI